MSCPTKEEIGLERITPSMLNTFEECPRLFYYRDWLGLKIPDAKRHMEFGSAFHKALETMYLHYDRNFGGGWMGVSFALVQEEFERNWKLNMITDEEFVVYLDSKKPNKVDTKEQLYEQMKEDGIDMLQEYWDNKELLLSEHGVDIKESEIAMRIPIKDPESDEVLPIPLSLRIDHLTMPDKDNIQGVVEIKTSGSKYDEEETRQKMQGLSYAFAYKHRSGKCPSHVTYIVNLKEKRKERLQVIRLTPDDSDLLAYYHRVKAILIKITNRDFEHPRTGHRPMCDCLKYEKLLDVR